MGRLRGWPSPCAASPGARGCLPAASPPAGSPGTTAPAVPAPGPGYSQPPEALGGGRGKVTGKVRRRCWGHPVCGAGLSRGAHLSSRCDSPCPHLHHAPGAHGHTRGTPVWWPGAGESAHGDPAARCPPGEGGEDTALVTALSPLASEQAAATVLPGLAHLTGQRKGQTISWGQVSGEGLVGQGRT